MAQPRDNPSDRAALLGRRIAAAAGIADSPVNSRMLSKVLAHALLAVVQDYLHETSSEYDEELFFEVNGRQPDDVADWPVTIIAGLINRGTPEADRTTIFARVVEIGAGYIRSNSPLARD